jgi:hypothetical protein
LLPLRLFLQLLIAQPFLRSSRADVDALFHHHHTFEQSTINHQPQLL